MNKIKKIFILLFLWIFISQNTISVTMLNAEEVITNDATGSIEVTENVPETELQPTMKPALKSAVESAEENTIIPATEMIENINIEPKAEIAITTDKNPQNNLMTIASTPINAGNIDANNTSDIATAAINNVDTTAISLAYKNQDGTDVTKFDYYTGESILVYAHFDISGTDTIIPNTKTKITIPKENIDWEPQFSRATDPNSTYKVTEDATNYYVEYTFPLLKGWSTEAVPFIFKHKQFVTQNWFKTPIKFEIFDENNNVIKSIEENWIAKTYSLSPSKYIDGATPEIDPRYANMSGTNKEWIDQEWKNVLRSDIAVSENEMQLTKTWDLAPYVAYEINLYNENLTFGKVNPKIKIIEKLPEWAQMWGEPNADGKYVYKDNIKWTYNKDTHTAIFEWKLPEINTYGEPELQPAYIKLSFPNQPYEKIHENKAVIILNPGENNEEILEEKNAFIQFNPILVPTTYESYSEKTWNHKYSINPNNIDSGPTIVYGISLENSTTGITTQTMITEILDYDLDDRLYYDALKMANHNEDVVIEKALQVGFKVYGIKEDGNEILIWENFTRDGLKINDVENVYKKIKIIFNEPLALENEWIHFYVDTKLKWSTLEEWRNNPPEDEIPLVNSAQFKYHDSKDQAIITSEHKAENYIIPISLAIESMHNNNYSIIYWNDTRSDIYFNIMFQENWIQSDTLPNDFIAKNLKHISLLPVGIDFIEWSSDLPDNTTIIKDYKNTGKTAVILEAWDKSQWGWYRKIWFQVSTTIHAKEWDNILEHYLVWDNNDVILPISNHETEGKDYYQDILDLDEDGNLEEEFLKWTSIIEFIPPHSVLIKKHTGLEKNNINFLESPHVDLNSDIWYKLILENKSLATEINEATLLDVLPYVGDHNIVANENWEYLPRGSEFAVTLVEPLENIAENSTALAKWNVLYSTDNQWPSTDSANNGNFVTKDKIDDFSQVKMIKLILKPGQKINVKEEVWFIVHAKSPKNKNLQNNQKTVNSIAASINSNNHFIEGNKVYTPIITKYTVNGNIFLDINKDGNKNNNDRNLEGYTVSLMNEDGSPALSLDGEPLVTTTDTEGNYNFETHKRWNYFVKFTKKQDNEIFTKLFEENGKRVIGTTGNDVTQDPDNEAIGKTDTFKLDPNKRSATRNAGVEISKGWIKIIKINEEWEKLEWVVFEIKKASDENSTIQKTTDQNGIISIEDLDLNEEYTIVEKNTIDGYILNTETINASITANNPFFETTIINKKQTWNLKVIKTDEANNDKKLANAKFELHDNGGNKIQEWSTNDAGEIIFTDIKYDDYTLVETESPNWYFLPDNPKIQISRNSFEKNLQEIVINVTNKQKIKSIKIIKKDVTDNTKLLANATFELKDQNNTIIATKTTDNNGEIIFESLPYGDYSLVETISPIGYKENVTPINITNQDFENSPQEVIKEVTNEKQKWSIKVVKQDQDGKLLPGVKFELRDNNNTIVKTEEVTNDNGEIIFNDVELGTYLLVETAALEGYQKIDNIVISSDIFIKTIETIKQVVVNKKTTTNKTTGGGWGGGWCITNCTTTTNPTPPTKTTQTWTIQKDTPPTSPEIEDKKPTIIFDIKEEEKEYTQEKEITIVETKNTEIKKYPNRMPRTGVLSDIEIQKKVGVIGGKLLKQIEINLPSKEIFKLAWSNNTNLEYWLDVVPEIDRKSDKFIVLPIQWLVMPIKTVEKDSKEYNNFINGKNEDFSRFLQQGAVELPGTSANWYGEIGNKVIAWHSSYWKKDSGRYKTHFQKIIGMEAKEEIWVYQKQPNGEYQRFVYRVKSSYNSSENDISPIKPTDASSITLFTCTPIGWIAWRWIVRGEFIGN